MQFLNQFRPAFVQPNVRHQPRLLLASAACRAGRMSPDNSRKTSQRDPPHELVCNGLQSEKEASEGKEHQQHASIEKHCGKDDDAGMHGLISDRTQRVDEDRTEPPSAGTDQKKHGSLQASLSGIKRTPLIDSRRQCASAVVHQRSEAKQDSENRPRYRGQWHEIALLKVRRERSEYRPSHKGIQQVVEGPSEAVRYPPWRYVFHAH